MEKTYWFGGEIVHCLEDLTGALVSEEISRRATMVAAELADNGEEISLLEYEKLREEAVRSVAATINEMACSWRD